MWILILGLVVFLGIHSVRLAAPGWRDAQLATRPGAYKGLYALASALGIVLIVWGYALARPESGVVFTPPGWGVHAASLLVTLGFIAIAAAYLPTGRIKAALKHPMLIGVMLWALGHLLANGDLASLLLFGAFLLWAVLNRIAVTRRDEPALVAGSPINDLFAVLVGGGLAAIFALWLHGPLIGVAPF